MADHEAVCREILKCEAAIARLSQLRGYSCFGLAGRIERAIRYERARIAELAVTDLRCEPLLRTAEYCAAARELLGMKPKAASWERDLAAMTGSSAA